MCSKLAEEMKPIMPLVDEICNAPKDQLTAILNENLAWYRPPGDLLHWTKVLNVFDTIFEEKIAAYGLDKENPKPLVMAQEDSALLVACLKFTTMLLRECRTRSLYSSQERIYQLCVCGDVEVLLHAMEVALQLCHKYLSTSLSKKSPPPKSVKLELLEIAKCYPPPMPTSFILKALSLNSSSASSDPATSLSSVAAGERHKYEHYSLSDSLDISKKYPSKWKSLNFQYFTAGSLKKPGKKNKDKKKQERTLGGVSTIFIPEDKVRNLTIQQLYDTASSHDIPEQFHLPFLLACLNAKAFNSKLPNCLELRAKLLRLKCMAFLAVCGFCNTDFTSTNLFEIEAYTFGFMVDLTSPLNAHISRDIFNTATKCLEVISLKRVWGTEIVRLMGGNVRHGHLYLLLKHISKQVREDSNNLNEMGFYSFFEMIENLIDTKVITLRFAAVGLLQDLTEFLTIKTEKRKLSGIVANILTNFLDSSAENVALFAEVNGFNSIIEVAATETDALISNPNLQNGPPEEHNKPSKDLLTQLEFLGNVFNIFFALVESDLGDRLQNLLDSSILKTFNLILANAKIVGEFVVSSVLNVLYRTLHNEPTAFSVFNENNVIDTLITKYATFFGPTFACPGILVEILGAISLNNEGLKKVLEHKLIHTFFQTFLQFDSARVMLNEEVSQSLATSFEELARHFPAYQKVIVEEIRDLAVVLPNLARPELPSLKFYTSESSKNYYTCSTEESDLTEDNSECIDFWAALKGSVLVDNFLVFCGCLLKDRANWSIDFSETILFSTWEPMLVLGSSFDFVNSNSFQALKKITISGTNSDKSYAFAPLLEKSFCKVLSEPIVEFLESPIDEFHLATLSEDPESANSFLHHFIELNNYLTLLSSTFFDSFDGTTEHIETILTQFEEHPDLLSKLYHLLTKCIDGQTKLLYATPKKVLLETSLLLLRFDPLELSNSQEGSSSIENFTSAKFKNTLQYRSLLNSVGTALVRIVLCVSKLSLQKKCDGLGYKHRLLMISLLYDGFLEMKLMLLNNNQSPEPIKFLYKRSVFRAFIRACSGRSENDDSLNIPALLVMAKSQPVYQELVDYAVDLILEFRTVGTAELKEEISNSESLLAMKAEFLKDALLFFGKLISEEDIGHLPTLKVLFNKDYCNSEVLLKLTIETVLSHVIHKFLARTIGSQSSMYQFQTYDAFSVLPVKIPRAILDVIQLAWSSTPTDDLYSISADTMGMSAKEMNFLQTKLGLTLEEGEKVLKEVGTLFEVELKLSDKTMIDRVMAYDLSSEFEYKPVFSNIGDEIKKLREIEDIPILDNAFVKIAAQLKLLENPFKQAVGFLHLEERVMETLITQISSKHGTSLLNNVEENGNMVRLLHRLLFLVSMINQSEGAAIKQECFDKFVQYFLSEISATQELADTTFYAAGLELITPIVSKTPPCVFTNSEPIFPEQRKLSKLQDKLLSSVFALPPRFNADTVSSLCWLLYIFSKDDERKQKILQSLFIEKVFSSLGTYFELCTVAQLKPLQDSIIQFLRIGYENSLYVENMMEASLRQLFRNKGSSTLDLKSILDESAFIVGRDPSLFVSVASRMLRLDNCHSFHSSSKVYLLGSNEVGLDDKQKISSANGPVNISYRVGIISSLFSQLTLVSREDWWSDPDSKDKTTEENVPDSKSKQYANLARNKNFRKICFLLQSFCELLGSYMEAKLEFITYSKKGNGGEGGNKPRSKSLNFFIHQLISSSSQLDSSPVSGTVLQRKSTVSTLAKLCLFALSSTPELNKTKEMELQEHPDLAIVRKLTAEIIAKTLRESVSSEKSTQNSYEKILGIFSLCTTLLSTKQNEVFMVHFNDNSDRRDDMYVASAFFDAQVTAQISHVLAHLDLNYPQIKKVSGAGLRVLSTIARIKLSNVEEFEASGEKDDEDIGDVEEKDDTPDLFRNSTLGLYDIDLESDEHEEFYDDVDSFNAISTSEISEDDDDSENSANFDMASSDEEQEFDGQEQEDFAGLDSDDSENEIDIIDALDILSESGSELDENSSDGFDESTDEGEFEYEVGDFMSDEDEDGDANDNGEDEEMNEEDVDWDSWISAFGESHSSQVLGYPHSTNEMDVYSDEDGEVPFGDADTDPRRSAVGLRAQALMNSLMEALQSQQQDDGLGVVFNRDAENDHHVRDFGEQGNPLIRIRNLRSLLDNAPFSFQDDSNSNMHLRSTSERWESAFSWFHRSTSSKLLSTAKQLILENIKEDSIRLLKEKNEKKEQLKEERKKRIEEKRNLMQAERERLMQIDAENAESDNAIEGSPIEEDDEVSEHVPIFVLIGDREVDIGGTDIDPEFFEALPEDMREEVFTQHVRERRASANHNGVREIDPDFLDALPASIREDILNQERMARLSERLFGFLDRERDESDSDDSILNASDWPDDASPLNVPKLKPQKKKYFNSPILDRAGVASVIRLLFVPVPINQREGIYRGLVSICHNKQTRSEAVNMLVAILSEGLQSQRSLERAYQLIVVRCKGCSKDTLKENTQALPMGANPICIGIQVLEAVLNLLENLPPLRVFMLTEHDNSFFSKNFTKKLRARNSIQEDKFPINLILKLLENPILSEEYFFVDLLASVVHYATIPLLVLQDKEDRQVPALFYTKFIPVKNLRLITRILSSGECLSSTFKRTMSSIQHLSLISDSQQVLSDELSENASALGNLVIQELKLVTDELIHNPSDDALNNKLTSEFTALSSNQAKLLRVLTALDYMYSTRQRDKLKLEKTDESLNLTDLYKHLKLGPLWEALSECLSLFEANPGVSNNATAILPLIESLMVVCKHSKVKDIQIKEMMKYQNKKVDFTNEPIERLFFSFTEEHKKILNLMVRSNPNLMSGPFSMLVRNPRVLEFDNKRNYFDRQLHDATLEPQKMSFTVRREQVFLDSYRSLFFKSSDEFKKAQLEITFKGELGVDAGGVTREWYQVLSRQMFNPDYALFTPVASDENTYHPNRTSHVNPEHLSFFKFIGRIIGKSIYDGCLLDCHFTRAVYKNILDRPVSLKDMETLDLDYFKSLMWMLENDITDIITEDFSVESDDYGEHKIIDLIPNGRNIDVTEENKQDYVKQVVAFRLETSVQEQMQNFIAGFHEIIPKDLVAIFDEQELELLISGLPDIDVQDWQNNTVYQNYSASSDQIVWFWRAVRSFDNEERAKLLQFATGTSKVPLNGFKDLRGANNVSKFNIHRDYGSTDRLPSSHTCFNQIDLPVYESYETLRGSLLLAITEGYEGFQLA